VIHEGDIFLKVSLFVSPFVPDPRRRVLVRCNHRAWREPARLS
jgi:hypothetical protein